MKSTLTLSTNLNCSPFEIFGQDTDEVITLINFYIKYGDEKETANKTISNINDGFWDM